MEFLQLWKLKFTWLNRTVKYNKGENLPEGMGWKERLSIFWWGSFAQKFKPWGARELICLASTQMPTYYHSISRRRPSVTFGSTTLWDKMTSPGSQRLCDDTSPPSTDPDLVGLRCVQGTYISNKYHNYSDERQQWSSLVYGLLFLKMAYGL